MVEELSQNSVIVFNKNKQIRLLVLVVLFALAAAITNYVILQRRAEEVNQAKSFTIKSKPEQSTISLTKDYKNPFEKDAQYINPFSQYKNPFDVLK